MRGKASPARRLGKALWLTAFAVLLIAGSSANGAVDIPEVHSALPDVDTRTTTVAPSAAQIAAAEQLGADVTWNQFGTPSSVYNLEGNLANGVAGSDAVAAVRAWLGQNKSLFRLSSADDLTLVRDTALVGGAGHAVLFGQTYEGVLAAPDGLVSRGGDRLGRGRLERHLRVVEPDRLG